MAVDLEVELVALLDDVTDIGLQASVTLHTICLQETYQVDNSTRSGLVFGALGQEEQALAGLAGPGGDGVSNGRLLILVEDVELFVGDRLIIEVNKALGEAQAPAQNRPIRTAPGRGNYGCRVTYLTRPGAL